MAPKIIAVIAAVLVAGALFTWKTVQWHDRHLRDDLLQQARLVAQAFSIESVRSLSGSDADLETSGYRQFKNQFAAFRQTNDTNDTYRFIYLLGRKADGELFVFVDNDPPDSKDYSPPGRVYGEAPAGYHDVFETGTAVTVGPITDRRGTRVSALIPLIDTQSGLPIAVLGMDVDARTWQRKLAAQAVLPVGLSLAILVFLIMSLALRRSQCLTQAREAELVESERKFRHLFERAEEGIMVLRGENVTFANPTLARMLGRSIAMLTSNPFTVFIHPDDGDWVMERHHKRMQGEGMAANYDFRVIALNGEEKWLRATSQVIEWEGAPASLSFLTDVTDSKKAEEERVNLENQLHQAQKVESIGHLAGGVAHDFNNMLGVILGRIELALMKLPPSHEVVPDLQEISRAGQRSADLTRQLLTFARKQAITPKVLDLNETLAGMFKLLQRIIGENIQLSLVPASDPWPVKVDPSQMDQILANLCVNARDAIAGIGRIIITTKNCTFTARDLVLQPYAVPGDYVRLAVSDDGCGMDKEILDKIFEPFFTTKASGKVTGLGLAMVYGAVKQNKGFIEVVSQPGQGTAFNIFLPRASHAAVDAPQSSQGPLQGGSESVLLVEDDQLYLRLMKALLEQGGYTVLEAATIDRAHSLAGEHPGPIHLLITDLIMPGMNGRDLSARLKGLRPEMKVLYMSGYPSDTISSQGVIEEGIHFMQKPVSFEALICKVREVLDQK